MKTRTISPANLVERENVRSGPIENPSNPSVGPFGVIFSTTLPATTSPSVSPSPDEFNPEELLVATLINTDPAGKKEEFQILGGYYCGHEGSGKDRRVNISQIFGIAANPKQGFNLKEGNSMLGDEWEMADIKPTTPFHAQQRKDYLNEREKGEDGWTFIVTHRPRRDQYPGSHKPMIITLPCPVIQEVKETAREEKETEVIITAEAILENPAITFSKYQWDWGDGTAVEVTDTPIASHVYARSEDEDKSFEISVSGKEPADCDSSAKTQVNIPKQEEKPCPKLTGVSELSREVKENEVIVTLKAELEDEAIAYTEYAWTFGDDTSETTPTPTATHHYPRSANKDTNYVVSVTGTKPEDCKSSVGVDIPVPKMPKVEVACPKISSIEILSTSEPNGRQIEVKLKAIVEGGTPDNYLWTWLPDQAPVTKQQPEITILLDRSEDGAFKCPIHLTITGPDNCRDEAGVNVHVPPIVTEEPNIWCTLIPWLLALFASMTLGILIVCYLAEDQNQLTEGQGLYMYSWMSIVTVIAMVLGFLWYYLGDRRGCPPDACNGLAVCGSVLFTGLILIFILEQCFVEANWQLLAGILLVLAIASVYLWIKRCRQRITGMVVAGYVAAIVLALLIVFYLVAVPSLECC